MEAEGHAYTAIFSTKTQYALPDQKFMIPASWARFHLSQLVNKLLQLPAVVPFDFLINGQPLRGSLSQWCDQHGISAEENLEIEYVESMLPPEQLAQLPHEDWVSSVSLGNEQFMLTASYDGSIRLFDSTQQPRASHTAHSAPITSACWVRTSDEHSHLVLSGSQDFTAALTKFQVKADELDDSIAGATMATLTMHTAPISCVACSPTGSHCITASWDNSIGLWTTDVPDSDEIVDDEELGSIRRKKKRKLAVDAAKRKAPSGILKSHQAKVTQAMFISQNRALSCGWDSTVRAWDIENTMCTDTITSIEKPFTSLCRSSRTRRDIVFAASTDRSVSLFDLEQSRTTGESKPQLVFMQPSMPSCLIASPSDEWRILSGGYDGITRIWDVRNPKIATASLHAFTPSKKGDGKILAADWRRGLALMGGENGVTMWKVGETGEIDTKADKMDG